MTIVFAFFWLIAAITLLATRISGVSVFIASTLVYSLPAFWVPSNGAPEVVWVLVITIAIAAQIVAVQRGAARVSDQSAMEGRGAFLLLVFNVVTFLVFLLVIALSGGIAIFFEGKYGSTPGGSIHLYYAWNSLLIVTAAINVASRKLLHPFNLVCMIQIALLFIGGDRTIPAIYGVVVARFYLAGVKPVAFLQGRRRWVLLAGCLLLPFALVSKSVYTNLPVYGFTSGLVNAVLADGYFASVARDFEPEHTHKILVYTTSHSVAYDIDDLGVGLFAILPGSFLIEVDPHKFSKALKQEFFPTWSDEAGVGANFWAQGWVVGWLPGVAIFAAVILFSIYWLDAVLARASSSLVQGLVLVLIAVLAFYVHRNSMEQVLSFCGRYVFVFFVVLSMARIIWAISPKKRSIS